MRSFVARNTLTEQGALSTDMKDRTNIIQYFEASSMRRWYKHEIVAAIRKYGPEPDDMIAFFKQNHCDMWFIDDILLELKS